VTHLSALAIEELRAGMPGEILGPGDARYDEARAVWNGFIDRRPAAIVRPTDAPGVAAAVCFASHHGLPLAVKGGGHNSAGTGVCDGGVVVDLSGMRRVTVDPQARTVRVQGGALLADIDRETTRHGLAVSGGIVSHTGIGGLTLGGGFGWISRRHGYTVDNLLAAEVVTADGHVVRASDRERADLFWGLRGGGGNFGVVTEFQFRATPIGAEVFSGILVKRADDLPRYMAFQRDYVRQLPDETTVWMVVRRAPPLPFLPASVHGQLVLIVPFVHLGDRARGEALIEPLRQASPSHGEMIGMHAWTMWQSLFDPLVAHGARNYWKSHHLLDLSDGLIDCALDAASRLPTDECEIFLTHMEGAPSRVPEEATAVGHRTPPFSMNIHTRWRQATDDARCLNWVRDFHAATKPFARGVYVNFISDEGEDRVRDAYAPQVLSRLVQVKTAWDPDNLFRVNQNIRPSTRASHA
jgi:FAD/FMN-containing dehydrogenase